jgi:hypothetical protein
MDLTAIRVAIAAAIASPTLRASGQFLPDPNPPVAMVWPPPGEFLTFDTMTDTPDSLRLLVTVLVAKSSDRAAQNALDDFLAGTNIWTALASDPNLGGLCSYAKFTGASTYNYRELAPGGPQYLGVDLAVEVML